MIRLSGLTIAFVALWSAAAARSQAPGDMPQPSGMDLAASNAKRFPQPVRAGDLLHRTVLQPVESQVVLGTVQQVVRDSHGTIDVVVRYGGVLGFGARPIAVPIDAMVLVGQVMEIVAYKPAELSGFPNFSPVGITPISPDTILHVGLAKPSH